MERIWFCRPYFGLPSQWPISRGHDEYARFTLVIGWGFTGQIVIATGPCGDPACEEDAARNRALDEEEGMA